MISSISFPMPRLPLTVAGNVIAWNRAIEEMTGIPAADMIGKGDHEYAIPFYGSRRKILIDLIFEPEETIREHYAGITREKDVLIAETNLPRPKGAIKIPGRQGKSALQPDG